MDKNQLFPCLVFPWLSCNNWADCYQHKLWWSSPDKPVCLVFTNWSGMWNYHSDFDQILHIFRYFQIFWNLNSNKLVQMVIFVGNYSPSVASYDKAGIAGSLLLDLMSSDRAPELYVARIGALSKVPYNAARRIRDFWALKTMMSEKDILGSMLPQ